MTRDEGYWDGATWVYEATLINGGTSGSIVALIVPGAGNEMELLYGTITNQDTSTRASVVIIESDDGANLGLFLNSDNVGAGGTAMFPNTNATIARLPGGQRNLISGEMQLRVQLTSVAASQDFRVAVVCRIRGGVPTVTATVTSGGSETVRTEKVF